MYGLVKDNKLYRLTFSKSLAEFLSNGNYDIRIFTAVPGKRIEKISGTSRSGLYGVVSSKNDKLLRVSLSKDHANFITPDDYRYLVECTLS